MGREAAGARPRPGLLSAAWRKVWVGGPRLVGLLLAMQLVMVAVCLPVIRWLFREAIRAAGMTGLDLGALAVGPGLTVTITLLLLIGVFAFWVVSLQFTLITILIELSGAGVPLTPRVLWREVMRVSRKLVRPSAAPLQLYLFLIVPLTGFGFASTLTQGIAIPPFVAGELLKSESGTIALFLAMLGLIFLNLRFCLAVPLFVLTDATGGRAMRLSWRLTRGVRALPVAGAVIIVLVFASFATVTLLTVAIVPTALADEVAPGTAPAVAAYSLGAAQTIGFLLTGLVTAMLVALLIAFLERHREHLDLKHPTRDIDALAHDRAPRLTARQITLAVLGGAVVVAITLGTSALATLESLSRHPETLVFAHRGFEEGGVENTLSGLNAAAHAGADLVEMDVMRTKDGELVAMHDANLSRLAGSDVDVKDLTLDELTGITVRGPDGKEDRIPSFHEYASHAKEIGMPLLVEIKLGGADSPEFVDDLVEELEAIGALHENMYHSLDRSSVARLKELRPDLSVGYIMPFAAVAPPETPADFIVVEEWTASDDLQHLTQQSGVGFFVWTVNSSDGQHTFLRRGVDGMITDHPDTALEARSEIGEERGLADTLIDLMQRFVVVF